MEQVSKYAHTNMFKYVFISCRSVYELVYLRLNGSPVFFLSTVKNLKIGERKIITIIVLKWNAVQILCIGTYRSQQTVQTKIRLLLSDQGLCCLPFHQHLLDALMQCYIKFFYF